MINTEADAQALLKKLRECDRKLNQPQVLFAFENESDSARREDFNEIRVKIATKISELENKQISELLAGLQKNESSLQQGINNLNREIETANNIAKITEAIDRVLKVITAVLTRVRGFGSRKLYALLVGIDNYPDSSHRLDGCVNDITAVEEYLNERFDQQEYQLHLQTLKDEQATREAVINGFRNHLCNAKKDDVVFFYYSGHGSQESAPSEFWHIEADHLDETLVCYDSRTENGWDLADKELGKLIAEVAEEEPHITIILDSCHSGSGTKDPAEQAKERRLDTDKRKRPLDSFIFKLEDLEKLSDTHNPEKHTTGWKLPTGRHVLLAACRDYETAKEDSSKQRGYFSYYLMDTLSKANGKLTYRDLFARTNAIVRNQRSDQSPQLEVNHSEDSNKFFLDGAIAEVEPYFIVNHDRSSGWVIEGGAVHGVQPSENDEHTWLALFPFDANIDDLRDPSKSVGTAKVIQVLPTESKIDIEGVQNLATDNTFKAVVTSLPLPSLGVYFEGDETGVSLAREKLQTAGLNNNPSAYVRESQEIGNAEFRLLCRNQQYIITKPTDERPIVAQIDGYTPDNADKVIKRLEHIARWTTTATLANTAATQIKPGDVEMELTFADPDLSQSQQIRLPYTYRDGEWQPPEFKLKLTNKTQKPLYCALVNLSDSFAINAPFFEAGSIRLRSEEEVSALIEGEEWIQLTVPDNYWEQEITEYKDILKLIVTKDELNVKLLEQEALDAPRATYKDISPNQSSLERLMARTQNRDREMGTAKRFDDWYAEEITFTTVRPLKSTPVSQKQEQQLGVGAKLQPHPSLVANVRLTTTPQASRDLGNQIMPPILREDPEVTQPFQFTTSRGTDPGLSVLELRNVADHEVVTPEAPLKLLVDASLADNEYLLPVGYDGELFLPLGYSKPAEDNKIEIELERLPTPVREGERSLQGSISIFFQKVISRDLGREFKYPILAVPEVGEDKEVTYNRDENYIKEKIKDENVRRIALYIHGIIGDTESLVSTIKQPVLQDGREHSINKLYDLVLTFDYENLNTTIEQNAQHLKRRLGDVGLSANHGKELHIIAHSMGGLVSRWFIEQEEGNKVVQHLIMLGTPNAGSPWSVVENWVKLTLGIALNGLSQIAPPAQVIGTLMGTLEKNIRVSLDQMNPASDFLNTLAASEDPGIPYSIIAGNTSVIETALEQQAEKKSILERLQQSLFKKVVEFPFFGEPNDIAVKVDSIKSVPTGRSHSTHVQEVPCDHMSYFLHEPHIKVGLEALIAAITRQE